MTSISSVSSIADQTKAKIDALIKTKTRKTSAVSKSREQLLDELESTTASSENLSDKTKTNNIELSVLNEQSKSYILSRFLDNQNESNEIISLQAEDTSSVKPPVPKPRTKICLSRSVSQATFEVTSPKFVKSVVESPSSNKTYNVEEVGDVLIHESPLKAKIVVKDKVAAKNVEDLSSDDERIESRKSEVGKSQTNQGNASEKEKVQPNAETNKYSYENIVEIVIHRTGRLELNSLVVHPLVKIHVVEMGTGKYFPKSDKTRSVVFFYENNDIDFISPVMTHSFNLQEQRLLFPSWEETILLNEDYEYLKNESARIIFFFEIVDFVSSSALHQPNHKGWHNIAFAFLKLSGKNNVLNVGKKMKLQLYYPHNVKKNDANVCHPWIWWKKKKLQKYPSVLYVTITPILSPQKIVETLRSKTPIQRESSSRTKLCDETIINAVADAEMIADEEVKGELKQNKKIWSRSPFDRCQLPNKCLGELNSYDKGCFVMKFSPSGLYLACAVQTDGLFSVIVFSVISLIEVHKFLIHQAMIYNIKWSQDDSFLASASADNTVAIITLSNSTFQILPHPSFVYCCDISSTNIIASGCYDGIVRIWKQGQSGGDFDLFQELEGHKGYVTTLCFNAKSNIFSADSLGVIIEWCRENSDWELKREFNLLDLRETPINQIILFSKEKRLLVHSRDSTIRIIDIKSGCVLQWLRGALNKKFQIFCTVSSCGNHVYSGSENGVVHVWGAKSGRELAVYKPFSAHEDSAVIHCVDFHPHDNFLAVSHFGRKLPVLIYCFDKSQKEVTINRVVRENEDQDRLVKTANYKAAKKTTKNDGESIGEEKFDFKTVLRKMDSVIVPRKSDK